MKRFILLFALVTGLALPAGAQDTPSDDGESFTIRLIQNALSDAGRVVNISGFSGGIFSNATMDRLTIADEEGVWLEIDNAELDWNRSALLRGRLQINTLTAETITLTRLPEAIEDDTPAPEATGFRIPNLRVAIDIDDVAVDNLVLGEAVLGQAATLTLTGSASLENGGMDVDIKVDRLDAPGEFSIDASYDPADTTLAVDLTLREPSGGIASSLMDLPGDPAIDLTVSGTGPLDDYRAEIDLDTDGEDRLTGAVTLAANDEGGRDFTVDLGGDITALVLQQYRDFFGTEVGLTAAGTVAADGALDLASFELSAAALDLQGTARLTGDFQPVAFDVTGRIQSEDGSRIELPFGNGISVASTTLDVQFDSAADTAVRGDFAVLGFQMPGYTAESLTLDLDGNIVTGADASFGADVTFAAAGLVAEDEAVGQALGQDITGSARIDWAGEGPVEIRGLDVTGETYGLTGDIDLVPGEGTMELRADARMQAQDLSAFAPVSGMNLSGAADLALDLRADLVGGTFDLV
ncbi:MAG: translocation/assembly module TamB, partial [Pseudooceanicola nanhaiensis]